MGSYFSGLAAVSPEMISLFDGPYNQNSKKRSLDNVKKGAIFVI
jgi:hypothetical protein